MQRLLLDSGDALGAVQLHLQDELGQLVQPAVLQRLTITAQAAAVTPAASSDTQLIGVTSAVVSPASTSQGTSRKNSSLVKGQISSSSISSNSSLTILFDKLQLEGAPGANFNVTFRVQEAPKVLPAVLQVELKPCAPGQAVKRGRDTDLLAGCTNCSNPFFSFDPTYPSCSVCPSSETYAHCSGDTITPAGKFVTDFKCHADSCRNCSSCHMQHCICLYTAAGLTSRLQLSARRCWCCFCSM
jgi:hypothetical protein